MSENTEESLSIAMIIIGVSVIVGIGMQSIGMGVFALFTLGGIHGIRIELKKMQKKD